MNRWLALLLLAPAGRALAQAPLDSARVTVSPDCGSAACWPFSVVLTARGQLDFSQALVHRTTSVDMPTTRLLLGEADSATVTPLPERIDRDPVLCPAAVAHQPVITVALYRGNTEWRVVDFRWCQPIAAGTEPADRANVVTLTQLRTFEDAIRALPAVVAHNKP